jgi:hypothetical protein
LGIADWIPYPWIGTRCFVWVRNVVKFSEKHRLTVFENRVLRELLGPKRVIKGKWRRLREKGAI